MIKQGVTLLVIGSLTLTSCASQNGQVSNETQTVAEGAGIGVLIGAGLGAILGGRNGALIGAGIGGLAGLAAGGYVAQQKKKYATIEQRIAGERQIAIQATATARSQTDASAAQLAVVEAELRDLSAERANTATARDRTNALLVGLQHQRTELESQKKELDTHIKNQQDFILATEKDIGAADPQKADQLAQWKAEIPEMQAAALAMSNEISDITTEETKAQRIRAMGS